MKHLILPALLLVLMCGTTFSQNSFSIKPVISTTVDSSNVTSGSDTVTAVTAGGLSSVTKGMRVVGPGIPFGTTVSSVIDTSTIILSAEATATDDTALVRYGHFTSAAYTAGDAMGFPFAVPTMRNLKQVILIDDAKQITSADLVFFSSTFTETADNAAFAPSDADAENIIGYLTVGGSGFSKALSNNTTMVLPFTTVGPSFSTGSKMYCQLVVVGTPTFTAVDNLTLKFIYE